MVPASRIRGLPCVDSRPGTARRRGSRTREPGGGTPPVRSRGEAGAHRSDQPAGGHAAGARRRADARGAAAALQVANRPGHHHRHGRGRERHARLRADAGRLRGVRGWCAPGGHALRERPRSDRARPAARRQRQHARAADRGRARVGRAVPVRAAQPGRRVLRDVVQPRAACDRTAGRAVPTRSSRASTRCARPAARASTTR